MLQLETLAQQVIDSRADPAAHAQALDALQKLLGNMREERVAYASEIARARERYAQGSDDEIEIDADTYVSVGEEGVFVSAWLWVPNPEHDDDCGAAG